jgi:hypothetical protein
MMSDSTLKKCHISIGSPSYDQNNAYNIRSILLSKLFVMHSLFLNQKL